MRTRPGRGAEGGCRGADYLRVMKGGQTGPANFNKKYCGKQTASLRFSRSDLVKLVFKSAEHGREEVGRRDGWSCKVTCSTPQSTFSVTPMKTTSTTTTTQTTTISTTTTTTTSGTAGPGGRCGLVPAAARARWAAARLARPTGKIICPAGRNCDSEPVPWQAGLASRGQVRPWCGATLITDRHVLTAAHCFEDKKKRRGTVKVVYFPLHLTAVVLCRSGGGAGRPGLERGGGVAQPAGPRQHRHHPPRLQQGTTQLKAKLYSPV